MESSMLTALVETDLSSARVESSSPVISNIDSKLLFVSWLLFTSRVIPLE